MSADWAVPGAKVRPLEEGAFVERCRADPDSLVYFLLNVGDGDTQLVLLPELPGRKRRAVVVDVATKRKLPDLVDQLADVGLVDLTPGRTTFPLVVGTHPHNDHIGGMPEFLTRYRGRIGDYWEPGYYHASPAYLETMVALEEARDDIDHSQPTSGMTRFLDRVRVTVLTPGIGIRNRFDSYGVEINNASIALKLEHPAARIVEEHDRDQRYRNRRYLQLPEPWSIILGADAQTLAWAQAEVDFPELHRGENTSLYRELKAAGGRDHLRGHVFKVPHHASKHGLNLELVERVAPLVALISSVGGAGKYDFPHPLAVEATREYFRVKKKLGKDARDDVLGIHYTAAVVEGKAGTAAAPLGSMAIVVPAVRGKRLSIWRFGDERGEPVDIRRAREMRAG